ncbi:hypothetical protein RHGRI_020737 [Rhododendron griersonianum]|uniref:Pentatricopeptide repeat-containing protein n=1 Tax=Rhododendron griersonianum TaxID=479676 RepID=A0AAV6JMQ2_9ERIC|nr:hypothetical protein RHGRI_020737 [Rhododendron griersonianum]
MFEEMPEKTIVTWTVMITGYTRNGFDAEALDVFRRKQIEGIEPDWVSLIAVLPACTQLGALERAKVEPNEITFVGLLLACTHAGFLDEGLKYFDSMREDYNIEPGIEHYGCLVDLLGRTGLIDRALETIMNMPMKPDSAIWGSLLSSCRTQSNLEVAVIAMEQLLELEPDDVGNYVLLSNIYTKLGDGTECQG